MWLGTMSLAGDGYLYFTANQLHRQPDHHDGKDLRVKGAENSAMATVAYWMVVAE